MVLLAMFILISSLYMDSNIEQSHLQFTNSTGVFVQQLFLPLRYKVPGRVYPSISLSRKQSHSLLTYGRRLLTFVLSIELKKLLTTITFQRKRTLHSAYRQESLAILSNSQDLHAAICKAQEYNIPLLQVCILTPTGEGVVRERILLSFAISHFVNQNFVLYGDWQHKKELFDCLLGNQQEQGVQGFDGKEGLYLRKGELVYAFIPLSKVATADEHVLQENLTKVRNIFYQIEGQAEQRRTAEPEAEQELSPEPSSELEPNLSQFGVMGVRSNLQQPHEPDFMDNFNDSDHEMDLEN